MCGLVTILSKRNGGFQYNEVEAWQEMLVLDQLRGDDSTGALTVLGNGQVKTIKVGSHAQDLFRTEGWSPFVTAAKGTGRILVGHNRKATKGSISTENAHPFNEGHIHLVHNGTLFNHSSLADRDVDSNAVAAAFAKEDAESVLKRVNGAFAFIWYDRQKKKLFAVRNKERPLYLFENDGIYGLCSELWMMTGALGRNRLHVNGNAHEKATWRMLDAGELVQYDPVTKLVTTRTIPLREDTPVTHYGTGQHYSRYGGECWDCEDVPFTQNDSKLVDTRGQPLNKQSSAGKSLTNLMGLGKEDTILCEIVDIDLGPGPNSIHRRVRLKGKLRMPGCPTDVDVTGVLPEGWHLPEAREEFKNSFCSAEILSISDLTAGPVIHCKDFMVEERNIQSWNGFKLSQTEWDIVVDSTIGCTKCNSELDVDLLPITEVRRDGVKYTCVCPDCVEKSITSEVGKNAFKQASDLALAACVERSQKFGTEVDGTASTQVPGSKSVH